jgi:hypothetical protein
MDFDVPIQTAAHVVISLIAIVSGAVVSYGFLAAKRLDLWTAVFLATTVLTSVTGFIFFPLERFTPAIGIGIISLIVLAVAILARYHYRLAGRWRAAYVIASVVAFYFNVFVLVAQLFDKVSALTALAPTQSEPPFAVAQLVVLVAFSDWGRRHETISRRADQSPTGVVASTGRNPNATEGYHSG